MPDPTPPLEQLIRDRLHGPTDDPLTPGQEADLVAEVRQLGQDFNRLFLYYEFGIAEVATKVDILRKEFERAHDYSPIEHVRTRLKSPRSLLDKAAAAGWN